MSHLVGEGEGFGRSVPSGTEGLRVVASSMHKLIHHIAWPLVATSSVVMPMGCSTCSHSPCASF